MDEGVTVLLLQLQRPVIGIVVAALHQTDLGAVALGGLDLGDGRRIRQADQGGNAAFGGRQRHTLCMVSGGAGDHALGFLFLAELRDLVAGAPELKGTGVLQIFGF